MMSVREKMMREFCETHRSTFDVFRTTIYKIAEEVKNSETIPQNEKLDFLIGLMLGTAMAAWEDKA